MSVLTVDTLGDNLNLGVLDYVCITVIWGESSWQKINPKPRTIPKPNLTLIRSGMVSCNCIPNPNLNCLPNPNYMAKKVSYTCITTPLAITSLGTPKLHSSLPLYHRRLQQMLDFND